MRKIFILLVIFIITNQAKSQDSTQLFKPFKVIASLGGTIGYGGLPANPGILFSLEPNYTLSDKVDIGMLFQTLTVPVRYDDVIEQEDVVSIHALANFYPVKKVIRPFIGGGLGYSLFDYSNTAHSNRLFAADNFSVLVRVGINYKHLNIALEQYIIKNREYNNYIDIKIGVNIGGGRKQGL